MIRIVIDYFQANLVTLLIQDDTRPTIARSKLSFNYNTCP
jgi:hypothetical protein